MGEQRGERADEHLVAGATAGWLDVWRRILNTASLAVTAIVGVALFAAGVRGVVLGVVLVVLLVGFFVSALVVGGRGTQTMRREMEAGYSTLLDVKDFELRDARSKELLRPATVAPTGPARRSLLASMFRVKPGTLVAQRLEQDEREN